MKLFGYLLVACAGLGLFACSTEDEVPTIDTGKSKSVTLKISGVTNIPSTKAIDASTPGNVGDTYAMALKDVRIVFYDQNGGAIYRTDTVYSTDPEWADLTDGSTGIVYHNINPLVDAVMIIGNHVGKDIDWSNDADDIKASELDAAGENTEPSPSNDSKDYVTLFGEDIALSMIAEPNADPHYDFYQADITLKPLVARFEIGNVQCKNLNEQLYASFILEGIGLIDFNRQVTLGTGLVIAPKLGIVVPSPTTLPYILEPNSVPGPGAGQYEFGDETSAIAWSYESMGMTLMDDSTDIHNPAGGKYAFNFFPSNNPLDSLRGFPNIKLVLDDVMALDPNIQVTYRYVATATFSESSLYATAGNIYKIDLIFREINIGPWDPTSTICVNVEVTVQPWTIYTLTPVFH